MFYTSSFVDQNAKYFSSMNWEIGIDILPPSDEWETWVLEVKWTAEVELLIQGQDSNPAFASLEHTKQRSGSI